MVTSYSHKIKRSAFINVDIAEERLLHPDFAKKSSFSVRVNPVAAPLLFKWDRVNSTLRLCSEDWRSDRGPTLGGDWDASLSPWLLFWSWAGKIRSWLVRWLDYGSPVSQPWTSPTAVGTWRSSTDPVRLPIYFTSVITSQPNISLKRNLTRLRVFLRSQIQSENVAYTRATCL